MVCLVIVVHAIEMQYFNVLNSSGDTTSVITVGSGSKNNPSMTVPIVGVISAVAGILVIVIAISLIVILR